MPSQLDLAQVLDELQNQRNEARWNDHPWERPEGSGGFDMFGSLQDNPLLRAARIAQYDQAVADETAKARLKDLRFGETPQSVLQEVYAPLAASRAAINGTSAIAPSPLMHVGQGGVVGRANPLTGAFETVFTNPKQDAATELAKHQDKFEDEQRKLAANEIEATRKALFNLKPSAFTGPDADAQYLTAKNSLTRQLVAAQSNWQKLPGSTASVAALSGPSQITPTLRPSFGFIGTPGGDNLFQGSFGKGLAASLSTPAKATYGSAEDVRAAFKSGAIDRATAKRILEEQFNLK